MMMECPRCGFAQPKDQYCASCGLDVDHYVVKPKPVWVRLVQNPTLHLSLIGALIVVVVSYIFYAQRELVSREVGELIHDLPLLSREAGAPNLDARSKADETDQDTEEPEEPPTAPPPPPSSAAEAQAGSTTSAVNAGTSNVNEKALESEKVELSSWEVPRETLTTLLSSAEKLGESNAGRVYLWSQGGKVAESIQSAGRRLALGRLAPVVVGSQIAIEASTAQTDPFQFGLYLTITKVEGKEAALKWDSTLVLPPLEAPTAAGTASASPKAVTVTNLSGAAPITASSVLLIVYEPSNRTPREEYITKAGEGPWTVLNSEDFRSGVSDWVMLIQIK